MVVIEAIVIIVAIVIIEGIERMGEMEKILGLLWGLALCAIISMLAGCRTQYVSVPEWHEKDSVRMVTVKDTVREYFRTVEKDSINTVYKGDTVVVKEYHFREDTKMMERLHFVIDSLNTAKTDSVTVVRDVVREVNVMRWWQKGLMWVGVACLAWMAWRRLRG